MSDKTYKIVRTKSTTDHLSDGDGTLCGAPVDTEGEQVFLREFAGCQKCREIAKGTYSRERTDDTSDGDDTLLNWLMDMDRLDEMTVGPCHVRKESRHQAPNQWDVTIRKSEGHLKGYKSADPYRVIDWIESHTDEELTA